MNFRMTMPRIEAGPRINIDEVADAHWANITKVVRSAAGAIALVLDEVAAAGHPEVFNLSYMKASTGSDVYVAVELDDQETTICKIGVSWDGIELSIGLKQTGYLPEGRAFGNLLFGQALTGISAEARAWVTRWTNEFLGREGETWDYDTCDPFVFAIESRARRQHGTATYHAIEGEMTLDREHAIGLFRQRIADLSLEAAFLTVPEPIPTA